MTVPQALADALARTGGDGAWVLAAGGGSAARQAREQIRTAAVQAAAPHIAAAERDRIIAVARQMGAVYPVTTGHGPGPASQTRTAFPFGDYLEDVPAARQGDSMQGAAAATGASAPPRCVNPGHDQSGPGACPGCAADLNAKYQALSREHVALGDRYNRMLTEQCQLQRDTKAAAYQRVWAEVLDVHSVIWASGAVRGAEGSIGPLLYQAGELLREDAGRTKEDRRIIAVIKRSAALADQELKAARPDPAADPLRAEVRRVREYVTEAGRSLHREHADGTLPCRCPGCELIRGIDDTPDPADPTAAAAATADEEPRR